MVEEVLDATAGRVEAHPRGRDALFEQCLAGAVELAVACGPARPPLAWTPCRSSPCTAGPSRSYSRSPGDSYVPANQEPIITLAAPAASASATSRGCRTPPSAQTWPPSCPAAAEHSTTAENWGRPTPVIIRVVHIAPGPTPTLTIDAPALIRSRVPSADTTLPAASGRPRSSDATALIASSILSWWPCAVSTTRRSAPASASARALAATSPLMPTAAAMRRRPDVVDGGGVDAGADGARARQHPGQAIRRARSSRRPRPGRARAGRTPCADRCRPAR